MDTSKKTPVSPAASQTLSTPAASRAPGTPAKASARPRAASKAGPAVVITVSCAVIIVAALAIPHDASRNVAVVAQPDAPAPSVQVAAAQPDAPPALPSLPVTVLTDPEVPKPVIEKATRPRAVSPRKSVRALPSASEAATSRAGGSAARAVVTEPATRASATQLNSAAAVVSQTPAVTITGCLETTVDGRQYRLTDTEGADAPKARSWRSGFLKRSAPVDLVEFSELSDLRKYVGHRVAATGVLTSRELHVRSLESAGSSCD
jgi:hypothetical protein